MRPSARRLYPAVILTVVFLLLSVSFAPVAAQQGSSDGEAEDGRPVVYLTFDSGPGPRTPEFLEVLDKWDAKATFFVIGRNVQNSPKMLELIVSKGHAVGNHTWSHQDLTKMALLEAQAELRLANQAVVETVGLQPRCWRPTFGEVNDQLIAVAASEGLSNESWIPSGRWDVDTVDWKYGYEFVLARLQTVQPGNVVLMHGGMNQDYEDLAALMTWLESNGDKYRFESLPGCTPTPASTSGGSTSTGSAPGSLAASDDFIGDLFKRDLELWVAVQRGSTYLGAFGSKR